MKIILKCPEGVVPGGADTAVCTEVIPESMDACRLAEQFCRLGRQREGCFLIRLDGDGTASLPLKAETQIQMVRVMVRSLYQGAYSLRKEGMKELKKEDIFGMREILQDFGNAVFYIESDAAEDSGLIRAVRYGELEGKCIAYARSLGNLPANYLGTEEFAGYIRTLAGKLGVSCRILDHMDLKEQGFGGILAVNQGSARGAKMALLIRECVPGQAFTALVGKGILFDSGGYHLKSMKSMEGMKFDMCGAANVLEAFEILVREDTKENLMAVLPLAENAIGPQACRMGDVITMLDGTTVEIYNTDAEGRLILADALAYAQQQGAGRIVDLATLTYSCHNALGDRVTGMFSNDERMSSDFIDAAGEAGEPVWRLPLGSHYRELLAWSSTADLANYAPEKGAGASVAACFLESFIREGVEWLHLDAVGPSVMREKDERMADGATGANIATIVTFLEKGN